MVTFRRFNRGLDTIDLVDIITGILDTRGVDPGSYVLHEYVDLDALARLLGSGPPDLRVTFSVEGIKLAVTPTGVTVLN